jgi:glycosyltransferase involved in cell wall biosynthesis
VPAQSQVRYWRWQQQARPFVRRLHAEHRFDLAHHLTWAVDWQPTSLADVPDLPFVWGPVGGFTTGLPMARWLGLRGLSTELAREAVTRPARRLTGRRTARRAALVLAQNEDVRRHFAPLAPTELAPNAAVRLPADDAPADPASRAEEGPVAVFAGRLLAWKGLRLAVAAVARTRDWRLVVFGAGPEEGAARRLAGRMGCAARVTFRGQRPRAEVLRELAAADALLHPSMHDSGPWIVAEAVTLGTPVVCLDRGGSPDLIGAPAAGVAVPAHGQVPVALAAALDGLPAGRPLDRWRAERLPAQIEGHYRRALAEAGR